jgi:hypothetical protein
MDCLKTQIGFSHWFSHGLPENTNWFSNGFRIGFRMDGHGFHVGDQSW